MRVQKYLTTAGFCSRRKGEELVAQGKVRINDRIAKLGDKVEPKDKVFVEDKPVRLKHKPVYLLLYKPKGYVTTTSDPEGRKTVLDLVADVSERVYPVGRLDYDTEGLLLLTNDGELTQGLSHPKFEIEKEYQLDVEQKPSPDVLKKLEQGVMLADGMTAAAKAFAPVLAENGFWRFRIIIHEGRNRQVRRMAESVGLVVRRLKRVRYAFLTLEGLATGALRHLTAEEATRLQELARIERE